MPNKSSLSNRIAALAADFARNVISSLKNASISDVYGVVGGAPKGTRTAKRTRQPHPGWPKCPVCGKNAWPRGKGYCHEHSKAGKAKAAGKAKPARKAKRARKAAPAKKPQE